MIIGGRGDRMRRREVMGLLGAAVVCGVWPPPARAQPQSAMTVGFLNGEHPEAYQLHVAALRQGLQEAGFVEGRNLRVDYRWARGDAARLRAMAAELVEQEVNALIATGGVAAVRAAQAATARIPVVFTIGADPVTLGLVKSLSRPGGNLTGVSLISSAIGAKRTEVLHKLAPRAKLALVMNPDNPNAAAEQGDAEAAARLLGQQVIVLEARNAAELDGALQAFVGAGADALFVATDPMLLAERARLIEFAARQRVPAIYFVREFALAGGLISYGASIMAMYRHAGAYVGKILKGARPDELPVVQPEGVEMVINLNTARALGIDVPPTLLALADEVIE
jgi:putative ABC transport system substrate-binding protein